MALAVLFGAVTLPASAQSAGSTFVPDPTPPALPAGSGLVAVADLTGNGIPDLVLANAAGDALGVMLGNGAGGFAAPTWFPVAGRHAYVQLADFNNDGHPDLLVSIEVGPPAPNYSHLWNAVQILFGDGRGGFTAGPVTTLPERGPVYVGDFTGNGNEDVLVAPALCWGRGGAYQMLLGDGHGDLKPGPVSEPGFNDGCRSAVGDFTRDGRDDILTEGTNSSGEPLLAVLPGQVDGSVGPAVITATPQFAHQIAPISGVGDLYGDGTLDVVLGAWAQPMGRVEVFKGNGAGGFSVGASYPSEQPNTFQFEVALGAFAGDGRTDIATIGSQLSVLANAGTGSFSTALTMPLGGFYNNAFVADINHDGRPDLILSFGSSTDVLLNEPVSPVGPSSTQPAPTVTSARESAGRWREGNRLARVSRKKGPPIGTTFSFSLSEPAAVSFRFTQHVAGRTVGRDCVPQTSTTRRRKACERTVTAGTLSFPGHGGSNKVTFQGRISRSKRLKPGSYRLAITATNSSGQRSAPEWLSFSIVKG